MVNERGVRGGKDAPKRVAKKQVRPSDLVPRVGSNATSGFARVPDLFQAALPLLPSLEDVVPVIRERLMRHPDLAPGHPGALLRRIVVPATGFSKTKIAEQLGVSRQTLYDVLAEKASVTPNLALRLGKMFGGGPEPWLRMQAAHDVWIVGRAIADELDAIPVVAAAE